MTEATPKFFKCDACDREHPLGYFDTKDDGTGNFTIFHCKPCYGDGWEPGISTLKSDDPEFEGETVDVPAEVEPGRYRVETMAGRPRFRIVALADFQE